MSQQPSPDPPPTVSREDRSPGVGDSAASVEDAVRSHVAWISAQASLPGGEIWTDGPLQWAWVAPHSTLHGLFPDVTPSEAIRAGLEAARERGAAHVVIWSATDRAAPELETAGFEIGWQPWWMGAETAEFDDSVARLTRRAGLSRVARDHERALQPLLERPDVRRAEAVGPGGRYAGRAWLNVDHHVAGLYDMAVRPRLRRQGFGRELLAVLGAEARRMGADRIVLNATPDGEKLYSACGFERLGEGRTWWWHRPR